MSNQSEQHYIGEVGTEIILNCGKDLTNAQSLKILVKKPNGQVVVWDAEPYRSDKNSLRHVTEATDFDQSGEYLIQSKVKIGGTEGLGSSASFMIYDRV